MPTAKKATKKTAVKIGDSFYDAYADSYSLFKVWKKRKGGDIWDCVIDDPPYEVNGEKFEPDWNGIVRCYTSEQILVRMQVEQNFQNALDASDEFYNGLQEGQIVHYSNGHGAFYRCKVVTNEKGEKMLLPIALVGQWQSFDLPRYVRGVAYNGYSANKVINGETFHPHASGIYEAAYRGCGLKSIDPRSRPAIDLTLPPQTAEQIIEAAGWDRIKKIKDYLDSPNESDPWIILENVFKRIQ